MIRSPRRVLTFVAHPDDLEPQAGGTIHRLYLDGANILAVTAVTPTLDRNGDQIPGHAKEREREAEEAGRILGIREQVFLRFDQYSLEHRPSHVQSLDEIALSFRPDLLITHGQADTQQDHVTCSKIAHTVGRKNRITIWEMNHSFPGGWVSSRPQPNLFVDITDVHQIKYRACRKYESQMDRYPGWEEGIEARDRYYGWMLNQEGEATTTHAEGFVVAKMFWE